MAVIPKRLAAPKDHLVARLRFGTVSVMAWSDAFSNSGYRLAIHGSAVDLLGLRRKVPIGDLDLIAYVTDGTGNQACTLVESLLKCSMIELKNRVNGRPFGYHAKGESLGGTSTRWSFTIYTDHPPVSTFDNVANSQILFLDNRELRSKYGDISIMLFLQSTRQVFVPDGWAVSRLPLRVAHRETCGYRCLNPVVDGRVFDSGWPVVDPTRFVADIDATFRSHFSESDAPSFLRLFFFAYSRIERFSNSRTTNAVLWNYVSDHIANHAQLRFLSPAEFAHYLYQHAIVPDAFQMLSVPTVTYDALFATQAAWNSCTQPESRAHVMADFAKMIRSLLGRVCESDGRTPDWVIAHSWMIGSTGPERFFDVVVLPAIDRLAPQEKAYCILELLSGSRLTSDQLFRFDLSSPSLLARIVPELVAIERSDDATIRGRLNTLNRLVKHDPSALDLVGNDAAQTIVAAWIRSDGFPPELYSRVISPLRDRIPPSIKAQSVLDQITKGKMSIVEIESFAGLDLSILERYVSQLIGLLPSDPPTYLSTVELTVQRYPKAIEFAKSMAFRPIIDAWGAQSTPSLTQFHTLIAPLLAGMETTERLHYLSTWISNGKLDPIKLDENQRKNPDIVRAMILRLVDRLQIVSTKKKMLNTELSVIPVSGIRGPFTATSPEMILGGMVAEFLGRGVEINGGRLFLRAVIPDAVPGSPLAEMLPRLLPICAAPQFYDAD
ncbi:hypothetical protein EBR57_02525, partial [bacterium]|nr:hypothetical protein [bacterium]